MQPLSYCLGKTSCMHLVYPISGAISQPTRQQVAVSNTAYLLNSSTRPSYASFGRTPASVAGCTRKGSKDAVWKLGRQPLTGHRVGRCVVSASSEDDSEYYWPEPKPLPDRKWGNGLLESVTSAVHKLGGTVTAGDISAETGLTMKEAEDALAALVATTGGSFQVELETFLQPGLLAVG